MTRWSRMVTKLAHIFGRMQMVACLHGHASTSERMISGNDPTIVCNWNTIDQQYATYK